MKELSIFVDESGDFGPYSPHSPYYLFSLVFHDQSISIDEAVRELDRKMIEHGFNIHAIHAGPIVRNEGYYKNYSPEDRKKLFNDLVLFTRKIDVKYHVIFCKKKETKAREDLINRLSKELALFLRDNLNILDSYDKIIIYYDNGQSEITTILTSVFNSLCSNVEFRRVQPYEYKLFQVANINFKNNCSSKSELGFFESAGRFKDYYYKSIRKKKI